MKILLCLEHGIAARYWLDVAAELAKKHDLVCVQNEIDYADYWFEQAGIPFNNGDPEDKYDVYITSGTDKIGHKIYDPRKVRAKRKIFMYEPLIGYEPLLGYDTALIPSEYHAQRLSSLKFPGKVVLTGYPPFEKAARAVLGMPEYVLVLSDWFYEKKESEEMLKIGLIQADKDHLGIRVKPHPYQRWREDIVKAELEFLTKKMIYYYEPNMTDIYTCLQNAASVVCVYSIGGIEATLACIPTWFQKQFFNYEYWGFKIHTQSWHHHAENRKIFMDHYKTKNVVKDIVREIEGT